MVDVCPFRGLRFNVERIPDLAQVICPPYDVISPAEQEQLYGRSPYNIVRLELGLEQPGDDEQRNRYTRAAQALAQWRSEGVLVQEPRPALYLHLERGGRAGARRDLIASVRLAEWSEGQVLPHERTMARPKADRFKLLQATATQLSPVWALYTARSEAVERAWAEARACEPDQRFVDAGGREHQLWALADEALLSAIRRDFHARRLYIADGHHRYETALHYRAQRRAEAGGALGDAPYEFVLMLLTPTDDPGLVVLPTHRIVHGGPKLTQAAVEELLSPSLHLEYFPVSETGPAEASAVVLREMERAAGKHVLGMYGPDPGLFTVLSPRSERALHEAPSVPASPALRELDVVVLHALAIHPLLGSVDAHEAMSYTRDPVHAFQAVREGQGQLALFLKPTPVQQILAVAEAGERMPEKSTYFDPKPPTGLVLYPLDSSD